MTELKQLRVAVLVTDGFEESELTEPVKALREAGAQVHVLAPHSGEIQAFQHFEKGARIPVDQTLESDQQARDYDALLLPGGALNADQLRIHPIAQKFVKSMQLARKPIAFICHAPWILVSSGLVKGRKLASYHTIRDDIQNAGGQWQDQEVVVDQNWVSSRQPSDIPAFNKEMLRLFSQHSAQTFARA